MSPSYHQSLVKFGPQTAVSSWQKQFAKNLGSLPVKYGAKKTVYFW